MAQVQLHLMRHGEAEPAITGSDACRALTPYGRERIRELAYQLSEQTAHFDAIVTSPLVRAVQTAEIIGSVASFEGPIHARREIAEPDDADSFVNILDTISRNVKNVLFVGHEPTMSFMTSHIVQLPTLPVRFSTGTIAAIDLDRNTGLGELLWMISGREE